MTSNRTARSTISYLIARDAAHEAAYAKALETLGVNWGKTLPIPKFDAARYPEVKELMDQGVHLPQHHWRLDGSQMGKVFQGPSPNTDVEGTLQVSEEPPEGAPIPLGPERPEEFSPGLTLTPELEELAGAVADLQAGGDGGLKEKIRHTLT